MFRTERVASRRNRLSRAISNAVSPVCENLEQRQLLTVTFSVNYQSFPAQAQTAFQEATAYLAQLFTDNVTVSVSASFADPGGDALAGTIPSYCAAAFDTVRGHMINDAAPDETTLVASLPIYSQIQVAGHAKSDVKTDTWMTYANARSLGFSFPSGADITIQVNPNYAWDYNRADGIGAGQYDFVGIMMHELAHGLGFVSNAVTTSGGTWSGYLSTLDLFRISPGTGNSFSTTPRIVSYDADSVFYDGQFSAPGFTTGEIPMADGNPDQTSHWRNATLSNGSYSPLYLGSMDPQRQPGEFCDWMSTDTRALGLIGWDVDPTMPTLSPTGVLTINCSDNADVVSVSVASGVLSVTRAGTVISRYRSAAVTSLIISGNGGDDSIILDPSVTIPATINGGDGNDTITGGSGNDSISGNAGNDSLKGGPGNDTLGGGADNDIVNGGVGNDSLNGGNGNDVLTGGADSDTMSGGAGDDTYVFGDTGTSGETDYVNEVAGAGTDTLDFNQATQNLSVNLSAAYMAYQPGVRNVYAGTDNGSSNNNFENIVGGSGADSLIGNAANNVITGNAGWDTMRGGSGDDTYFFGNTGNGETDFVYELGNQGTDTLDFNQATQNLSVNLSAAYMAYQPGVRNVYAGTDNGSSNANFENIVGGSGADSLIGNAANNVITGNAGWDTMRGGSGDDTYFFGNTGNGETDFVYELANQGTDTLDFSQATQNLSVNLSAAYMAYQPGVRNVYAGTDNGSSNANFENIIGGWGDDGLTGNAQNNVITGGAGNDILSGGGGMDTLLGGDGNDTIYARNSSADSIDGGTGTNKAQVDATLDFWTNIQTLLA